MRLTDAEQAMLDGKRGKARQKAMDLLVRYGEALGAERLVETNNVCGTFGATTPFVRDYAEGPGGMDAVFSEFNLDSAEVVEVPPFEVHTSHLQQGIDPVQADVQGVQPEIVRIFRKGEAWGARRGVQPLNTCTPYLVGNVPTRGEHCAWMESSAVIYINSVLGARTNAEGRESAGAAALTGRIPYWGYHIEANRRGTDLAEITIDIESTADWGLFGYWLGEIVQDRVPVIGGVRRPPSLARLKHFGAAAASSGGVEMYHLVGITPEAPSRDVAFGGNAPRERLVYDAMERRRAYDAVNSTGRDRKVDYVMLGCPHYSIEQIWEAARLLEGKRVHADTGLWIFTPRAIRQLADQAGYTKIIEDAGAHLMSDTCSAMGRLVPAGTRVAACDSVKQAHYLPAIMGIQAWFGTTAQCIQAAIDGRWTGELP